MYYDWRADEAFMPQPGYAAATTTPSAAWFSTKESIWLTMLRQFEALWSLQDGWDGDDAKAPTADLLGSVRILLDAFKEVAPAPTRILPMQDGGVVIEWRSRGRYLEIEIEEPYCGEIMEIREGAKTKHDQLCWREQNPSNVTALPSWPDARVHYLGKHAPECNGARL